MTTLDQIHTKIMGPDDLPRGFLAAADVPLQKHRLHVGDRVRIISDRRVVRVGYRKIPSDYYEEVRALLGSGDGFGVWLRLEAVLGFPLRGGRRQGKLIDAIAFAKAQADGYGGPDRGVWIEAGERSSEVEHHVDSIRHARLGRRYGARGSTGLWTDDYEPGGLAEGRTITICGVGPEYLSGDLELIKAAARPRRKT